MGNCCSLPRCNNQKRHIDVSKDMKVSPSTDATDSSLFYSARSFCDCDSHSNGRISPCPSNIEDNYITFREDIAFHPAIPENDSASISPTSFNDIKNHASKLSSLLSGIRPGSDLLNFQVPLAFNLPKSQLQMYGESVTSISAHCMTSCAHHSDPGNRMLAVARWHISTIRVPEFGKAPYNPVLGETLQVQSGDLNVFLEQVSHHPPITAIHASNSQERIRLTGWHKPIPIFFGAWLEVRLEGRRTLHLDHFSESYDVTLPRLLFRFLPFPVATWIGQTKVSCQETGFEARVDFKAPPLFSTGQSLTSVKGHVIDTSSGRIVHKFGGEWDGVVHSTDTTTGKCSVLLDAGRKEVEVTTFDHAEVKIYRKVGVLPSNAFKIAYIFFPQGLLETDSTFIWRNLTNAIRREDWVLATSTKVGIEEMQRKKRKEREVKGIVWKPLHFHHEGNGNWVWKELH